MNNLENFSELSLSKFDPGIQARYGYFFPNITLKTIPLSLTGVHPRTYFDWKKNSIVSKSSLPSGEWIKLDLIEFVWIKLVQALRDFGVSYPNIMQLKQHYYDSEEFFKILKENKKVFIERTTKDEKKNKEDKKYILDAITVLDTVESIPDHLLPLMTLFSSLVLNTLFLEKNSIIVGHFGSKNELQFTAIVLDKSNEHSFVELIKNRSTLCISLIQLVNAFLESIDLKRIREIGILNSDEIKVLDALREGKFDELIVERKKEGTLLVSKKMHNNIKDSKAQELIKIFGLNNYDEVTLKYRNEKEIYFKSKKVIKL